MHKSADASLLDNPFWRFSTRLYSQASVSTACLELQDQFAADVNMLLFCKWSALAGPGRLQLSELRDCVAVTADLQGSVIQVLRGLRRKQPTDDVPEPAKFMRRQLAELELAAERLEQALLYCWSRDLKRPENVDVAAEAARNLVAYLSLLSADVEAAAGPVRALLAAVVDAE